ncbi:MAG: altered inheritance of mitochondria protein 19 [Benjaminiella poitrasii]|nr:MAG: altered inheritance of mitochondria protein 19 [Benjaminiella poitrasii]
MSKIQKTETKATTWIDKQSNSPYPVWALSALTLATLPLSARKSPGIPSVLQTVAFSAIFAGAGYVINTGDADNGSGISTAWCLSWSFLNAKTAMKSMKPVPITLLSAVALNTIIYGKRTLKVNGYID